MADAAPHAVEIVEVGPRDGLQNEATLVSTAEKVELVARALAAGVRRVELASFVNPRRVPQMADAEAVVEACRSFPDLSTIGLVMNDRGLQRAIAAGVDEVNVVVITTDEFSRRNSGCTTAEAVAIARDLLAQAKDAGCRTTVTVGAAFGCPFTGEVPVDAVLRVVQQLAGPTLDEVSLADTIGVAVPRQVTAAFAAVRQLTDAALRCHLHNTRNTGLANALAAVEAGVTAFDVSTGGIGGCPFAPNATGNLATEDLVYALERSGIATGVDLAELIANASRTSAILGAQVPGLVSRAGGFPSPLREPVPDERLTAVER